MPTDPHETTKPHIEEIAKAMFNALGRDTVHWYFAPLEVREAFFAMAEAALGVASMLDNPDKAIPIIQQGERFYSTDGSYPLEVQSWGDTGHVRIVPRFETNGIRGPILRPQDAAAMGQELIRLSERKKTVPSWLKQRADRMFLRLLGPTP